MTRVVLYEPKSTTKIAQLTGEWDAEHGVQAQNRTQSRYHLLSTDEGASVFHDGRVYFLFGDTFTDQPDPVYRPPGGFQG